jgi:hypothetical protein
LSDRTRVERPVVRIEALHCEAPVSSDDRN